MTTVSEFREAILFLVRKNEHIYKRSLEEYLRSLLITISETESEIPSYARFLEILDKAFQTNPHSFEQNWSQYTRPPDNRLLLAVRDAKSKTSSLTIPKSPIGETSTPDFESLRSTLLFQIAELRRFTRKEHRGPGERETRTASSKYFGLQSTTGHSWYNWDPFTYLECATAGLIDNTEWLPSEFKEGNSWAVLACLLEWGRLYE